MERSVLKAISAARAAVPDYGRGKPIKTADVFDLVAASKIEWHRTPDISVPAILTPPVGGAYQLVVRSGLGVAVERFIGLHEAAHVMRGDVEEPTILHFTGRLPEAELCCDLFALAGLIDATDTTQGPEWLAGKIRDTVPLDDRGWQLYRVQDLAPRLIRLRLLIDDGWADDV